MNVSAGVERCNDARAVFVTPSHQFPLGMTMSAARRLQLLQWAHTNGAWIIEDDYDSEFRYDCEPIASLQGLDGGSRVIYIGTFSKVLFPSLRLGYVVLPADLVDRFLALRRAVDISPPTLYQNVLADFLSEGHFARHIRRMRGLYKERRDLLVRNVVEELGSAVEIVGSEAGMHLTLILKTQHDDVVVAEEAARRGLWIWPLSRCYLSGDTKRGFILGFGSSSPEEIPAAVRKLRKLLSQ
jgi:GntR family transcriptional regulator/MocR family aminotransferase